MTHVFSFQYKMYYFDAHEEDEDITHNYEEYDHTTIPNNQS